MACKCPDLTGEVDALPFMPLLRDPFARGNAFNPLEAEGGEVPKDNELVDLGEGERCVLFVCHTQVVLDLFPQIRPSSNIIRILCGRHWVRFLFINKVYHVPFFRI